MSEREATHERPSVFSIFHRDVPSTRCKYIDLDWIGYCESCYEVYVLFEETKSPLAEKNYSKTQSLARQAGIPAYAIQPAGTANWTVQQIAPVEVEDGDYLTHDEMEDFMMRLRDEHRTFCKRSNLEKLVQWDSRLRRDVYISTGEIAYRKKFDGEQTAEHEAAADRECNARWEAARLRAELKS